MENNEIRQLKLNCAVRPISGIYQASLIGKQELQATGATADDAVSALQDCIFLFLANYSQPVKWEVEGLRFFAVFSTKGDIEIFDDIGNDANLCGRVENMRDAAAKVSSLAARKLAVVPEDGNFLSGNPRLDLLKPSQYKSQLSWFSFRVRYLDALRKGASELVASKSSCEIPEEVGMKYLNWIA